MRNPTLALASAALLLAGGAGAETYTVLRGTLTPADGGAPQHLTGWLEVAPFEIGTRNADGTRDPVTPLRVDDFALEGAGRVLTPSPPVVFDGLRPFGFLEPADQILLDVDDAVALFFLRAGGEVVAVDEDEVTFRFLDVGIEGSGGRAIGSLGEGPLPRRLELQATLFEVDQTFRIQECIVRPLPRPPPGGGGVIIGGGTIVGYEPLDIGADEPVLFVPPDGGAGSISLVTGDGSAIEGKIEGGATLVLLDPPSLELGPVTAAAPPTLASLGITAPDGATVDFDAAGVLTVSSEGDLFVEGSTLDVPGLTHLVLETPGSITLTGMLVLPVGVDLTLDAGTSIEIEGSIDAPDGDIVVLPGPVPGPRPICAHLRPIIPAEERVLGTVSLVTSAARQIGIDVQPWSRHARVLPGLFPRRLLVALLGAPDLDVRAVDPDSLRLGEGEAPPLRWPWPWHRRHPHDVNRDGHPDLLSRFEVRDAEIAWGDEEVCLVAQTHDGELLEGCDAIDTTPPWLRRHDAERPWHHSRRSGRSVGHR